MVIRQRVMRMAAASAVGQAASIATQIGLVPLFLMAWGVERYGDWLLLTTIPAYLAASDLGFLTAASNRLSALRSAGADEQARQVHRLSWALALLIAGSMALTTLAVLRLVDLRDLLHLRTVSAEEAGLCLVLLVAFTVAAQAEHVVQGAFRAEGLAPRGSLLATLSRSAASVAAALTAVLGGDVVHAATAMLATKALVVLVELAVLRRTTELFRPGLHLDRQEVASLLRPSLGFAGLSVGHALTLQVFLVVLGHQVGATELVAFSLARTLSRLARQLISIIEGSIWPELTYAHGRGDRDLMRRLHAKACWISVCVAVAAGIALVAIGPVFLSVWTAGKVHIAVSVMALLCLDLVVTSLWSTSSVLPSATNEGLGRITLAFTLFGAMSVLLLPVLVEAFGLLGAPLAMLACDALMVPVVLRTSLGLLDQPWLDVIRTRPFGATRPARIAD